MLTNRGIRIPFSICLRSDDIFDETVGLLKKLQECGLDLLFLGIESGNNYDLTLYGKGIKYQQNVNAISLLNKNNIYFEYGFIMFNPYTTFENIEKNIAFFKENDILCNFEVLSRRMKITSGVSILGKLKRDKLIDFDGNLPVENNFAYRFMNPGIDELYKQINIVKNIDPGITVTFSTLKSILNALKLYKVENTDLFSLEIREMQHDLSVESIKAFEKIVEIIKFNKLDYLVQIQKVTSNYSSILSQITRRAEQLKNRMSRIMYKRQINIDRYTVLG